MNSKIPIALLALLLASACKNDTKTQAALDETAQDTSLARDLALAGADTLLYSEAADVAMTEDTTTRVVDRAESVNKPTTQAPRPAAPRVASPISQPQPASPTVASSGNACASADAADQRRCLMQYLARSDASLNRTYQNVIRTLGPAQEERLRQAQRAWLVYRDTECRRKTRSSEGALWAPVRAKCLGEYSAAREQELAAKLQ